MLGGRTGRSCPAAPASPATVASRQARLQARWAGAITNPAHIPPTGGLPEVCRPATTHMHAARTPQRSWEEVKDGLPLPASGCRNHRQAGMAGRECASVFALFQKIRVQFRDTNCCLGEAEAPDKLSTCLTALAQTTVRSKLCEMSPNPFCSTWHLLFRTFKVHAGEQPRCSGPRQWDFWRLCRGLPRIVLLNACAHACSRRSLSPIAQHLSS